MMALILPEVNVHLNHSRRSSLYRFRSRSRYPFPSLCIRKTTSIYSSMEVAAVRTITEKTCNSGVVIEEEYDHQTRLLQEFYEIPSIEKAWISRSSIKNGLQAMISLSQLNLPANKKRKFVLSAHILEEMNNNSIDYNWSPFPIDHTGATLVVPSPSGLNLLVVRNGDHDIKEASTPVQLEIWGPAQMRKEIFVPPSIHGPLFTDGWFEGISWNSDETCIAYVAEDPAATQPVFTSSGYRPGTSGEKEPGSWKGQGDWLEDWGETYSGKRRPTLFVLNIKSGTVQAVEGIPNHLSVGQVVWAPQSSTSFSQYLVFVGWSTDASNFQTPRKLGMKYCYNRPCALYVLRAPLSNKESSKDTAGILKLTENFSSAFLPRFSPDGELLVFLSANTAVNTGAHCATNSLHSLHWPSSGIIHSKIEIKDVVPVVMCPREDFFPGLYCTDILPHPWLSDGHTLLLSSIWGSMQVLLAINVLSGTVSKISPQDSNSSWNILAVQDNIVLAVSSSPAELPNLKYGHLSRVHMDDHGKDTWSWLNLSLPSMDFSEKVNGTLSSIDFKIFKIPVAEQEMISTEGARQPFEAIFVSSKCFGNDESQEETTMKEACNPLIVVLHGGPHSTSLTSFSRAYTFLSSLGFNLLHVNYRGSLGFGEEALQSLPGNIGRQDVADVLNTIDLVIGKKLANPTNIAVLGGSHGGFLTTHLIGQAPDRFVAASVRNPVCNLSSMVATTDIPDWCYVETYGKDGKGAYTEAPTTEDLNAFYYASPISHVSKVKVPVLFLLGAKDLRVPVSNGLQYARALKENGVEVKVIIFPNDVHVIDRPQSDFESFLNIGVWFKRFFK
ncbi:acylamino-acid-releasing enzyme 1 isoform X1 [Cryptomeria japonica]|uniref:acylamino-acid-releasing enzyme 1 isoform X1 n=2 Tax=Cryptomeria japonica TaxID=3369 RepID=UPI0027DAA2AB|nr:acylamino-acid-releasing enzyme 1 isoform X1 [Cryptomeria japonica]